MIRIVIFTRFIAIGFVLQLIVLNLYPLNIPTPKNIIYFISDGMGYNHVDATSYFQYGESGRQVYESPDWVKLALSTYPGVVGFREGSPIYAAGYNPREANTNYNYVNRDYTDSGAAATTLSTGKKVFSGSIGIGIEGDTLWHISQSAKALGKSIGVVASVPISHATPAGFFAHNSNRRNYSEIARYMFFKTKLDVIMGTGNPGFNNNGEPTRRNDGRYIGGVELWEQLTSNTGQTVFEIDNQTYSVKDATGDGNPDPWHVIQTREEFIEYAEGETPTRIIGVAQVRNSLQEGRYRKARGKLPFDTPLNERVPTLEELTKASLNILGQNPEGFFVMIEGGAIDWASHSNHSDRMIEEQVDFNKSVEAAVEWVENNSSWDETLIIVTSDHETGYLTGPGEPDPLYPPIVNNGKGNLPGMQWNSGNHTNKLVPMYAKGSGAEIFKLFAGEYDPQRGPFLQNTQIPQAILLMWGN